MRILVTISLLVLIKTVAAQTFQEIGAGLGIDHNYGFGSAGGGVSFYDFNQDGWDDLTFASHSGESIYFFENRQGTFIKTTSFVSNFCESKQLLWVDYDNDGDKDLFVSCYQDANRLYNNNGNMVFTDVTEQSGLPLSSEKTFGIAWADYDNDGWLDLYITNKPEGTGSSSNQLYRNMENGTFLETTSDAGVADVGKKPFSVSFLDYNNDGAPDIYIAQDKKAINTFLENNGDGSFDDVSVDSKSDLTMEGMCVAVGDYDNDGYQDIYISNISEGNRLLNNNGNETFSEVAENTGVSYNGIGWGSNFLDYDNDGDLDLYVSGSLEGGDQVPSIMYTNNGAGSFENVDVGFAGDTVISFSNAVGDIDNDGYPDVAVNNFGAYPSMVWRNSGGTNNWIKIQLQGVQSNRDGIGTSIRAYFDNKNIIRYTHCGIGFLAQNSSYESMGIGDSESIDSLIISWPNGHIDKLFNLEGNQKIKVIEGATLLPPQIEIVGNLTLCTGDSTILETGFYKSYLWSTGETTRKITVSNSENVSVNVEDYAGNEAESETVTILAFDSLELSFDTTPSSTNTSDGKIQVSVNGGSPPYVFKWDDPSLGMTDLVEDLPPGEYAVTVKDSNGCEVAGLAEVSLLVGLPEEYANLPVRLFPNPASSQIVINLESIPGEWLEFKLADLSGKLVKRVYFDLVPQVGYLKINIENIRSGLYFAEIRNGENWFRNKIVVSQ